MQIQAISFDVDGTLFDLRHMRGLCVGFEKPFVDAYRRSREQLRGRVDPCDLRAEQCASVAAELGRDPAEITRLVARMVDEAWADLSTVDAFPNLREALTALRGAGLRLALLSDYAARRRVASLRLDHVVWEAEVSCEALGVLKPHRLPFERLLEVLALPPAAVLHVGDRVDADVVGARAIGMRTALFAPHPPASAPRASRAAHGDEDVTVADIVFRDYAELLPSIASLDRAR